MSSDNSERDAPVGGVQGGDLNSLARKLKELRLAGVAAAFLESGGAFSMLAAQGLYIGQPLMETWIPKSQLHRLAQTLEDPAGSAELIRLLRDEPR